MLFPITVTPTACPDADFARAERIQQAREAAEEAFVEAFFKRAKPADLERGLSAQKGQNGLDMYDERDALFIRAARGEDVRDAAIELMERIAKHAFWMESDDGKYATFDGKGD